LGRVWRLLGWFAVVELVITAFGVTTAPLLLVLVTDIAAALLLVRGCMKMRAVRPVNVPGPWRLGADSGR